MRRRQFIQLLGGTLAWPVAARAQPAMPVIGLLSTKAPDDTPHLLAAFRQGLKDTGFAEGQNIAIEYRSLLIKTSVYPRWQPIWFAVKWR